MLLWLVIFTEPWVSDLECRWLVLMETAEDKGVHLSSQSITGESMQLGAQTVWQSWQVIERQVICLEMSGLKEHSTSTSVLCTCAHLQTFVHKCVCVCTQHILSSIIYTAWHYNFKGSVVAHITNSSLIGLEADLTRGKTYMVLETQPTT